jgi:hypothetical protein
MIKNYMIKNKHLKNLTINKSLLKNHIENLIKEKKNIIKPNIDHSNIYKHQNLHNIHNQHNLYN